ncbi:MAG: hypothetical protein ACRDFS_07545, partial [Chloroflexota bacterium]
MAAYLYDGEGDLESMAYNNGPSFGYAYDYDGNLLSQTDPGGTSTYTYDPLGRLTDESLPGNEQHGYQYDPAGNLVQKTDNFGSIGYTYNAADEPVTVTDRQGQSYNLSYDQDGNESGLTYPNGISETIAHDANGEPTDLLATMGGQTVAHFTASFTNPLNDKPGDQLFAETALVNAGSDTINSSTSYTYDAAGNLSKSAVSNQGGNGAAYSYRYDAAGNLTNEDVNGAVTGLTYNSAEELTKATGAISQTYTYDANGELVSRSDGLLASYNPGQQTVSMTPPGGSAISMSYRGASEAERIGNGGTTYQYDATVIDEINVPTGGGQMPQSQETSKLGRIIRPEVLQPGLGGGSNELTTTPFGQSLSDTIVTTSGSSTSYPIYSPTGTTAAVTSTTGAVVQTVTYDANG